MPTAYTHKWNFAYTSVRSHENCICVCKKRSDTVSFQKNFYTKAYTLSGDMIGFGLIWFDFILWSFHLRRIDSDHWGSIPKYLLSVRFSMLFTLETILITSHIGLMWYRLHTFPIRKLLPFFWYYRYLIKQQRIQLTNVWSCFA